MIAALYVEDGGVYFGLQGVDPWPESRDARNYHGPYPVVAHPPCQRWGRYWSVWLYAVGVRARELTWGPSAASIRLDEGYHSAEERRRAVRTGACQRLSKRQRAATPIPFRDLLLDLARTAR